MACRSVTSGSLSCRPHYPFSSLFQSSRTKTIARCSSARWRAGKIPHQPGQDLPGEVRVLLRDRPFLPRNARSAQDDRRGLEVHPRLHQQEAERSDAVLVSGRQRVHGMDRSVPASEGDGMGGGFSELHGQEHHVLHGRLRPCAEDPSSWPRAFPAGSTSSCR